MVSLQPILTSFLAKIYLNETLTKFQWLGIILGFSGALIIIISDLIDGLTIVAFFAGIVGLVSSSLGIIWQKKIGSDLSLSGNNFLQALSAAIFHLVLALCFEKFFINFSNDFILAMSWQIFAVSLGAFLILMYLLAKNKANETSTLFLLQVKVENEGDAEETFSTLMGEAVEHRKTFIQDNALKVSNLDI